MANTIKIKQSSVAAKVPTTAQLALGELAVNTYDGKLYFKKNVLGTETIVDVLAATGGTVTGVTATAPVLSSGGNAPVISMAAATTSVPGYLTAADWTTFNAKAPTASPVFSGTFVTGASIAIRGLGAGSEGGQLTLGYGNNAATAITGQANSTWNVDVDTTNDFRIFRQNASGAVLIPITIDEGTGAVTFANVLTGTSFNSITGLSATTPLINGTATVGTGTTVARADHIHPTDTSRAAIAQTMYLGTTSVAINRASAAIALTGITSIDGNAATATTATNLSGGTVSGTTGLFTSNVTFGSGNTGTIIRPFTGGGYGAIYSPNITPGATNYSFAHSGAVTWLNGTSSSGLAANGVSKVTAYTTGVTISDVLTMLESITTETPTALTAITQATYAPINVGNAVNLVAGNFAPMMYTKTTNTSGFASHISLGSYRKDLNDWGRFYIAVGNNDLYPTSFFDFSYSGEITNSNGSRIFVHSLNYNNYAPTLSGVGASGTWGINITGSSAITNGVASSDGDRPATPWLAYCAIVPENVVNPVGPNIIRSQPPYCHVLLEAAVDPR